METQEKKGMVPTYKEGKDFDPAPSGNHLAICYSMIHIGTIENYYGEMQNVCRITWELCEEKRDDGKPFIISKDYTFSLATKANLRKDLEGWRGKAFTEDEAKNFDMSKLLGVACLVNVIHKTSEKTGKTYANVSSVSKLPKGMNVPNLVNEKVLFYWGEPDLRVLQNLPDFIREKVEGSEEFQAYVEHSSPSDSQANDSDEDLPF